ncbi:Hypothetical protein PHPALM_37312 [Phytophthora palmivora]|uniref:Uncharacterized protein n=1 Tax=Phytophthora palmivora TaxID=4796 RepID=A0A2P4WXS7_9STRA|nr:Hypothetical protein PHPALM_37312 [Phytophthora palmivora]
MSSGWENSDCSDCEEYYECEDSLNEDDWDSDWPFSNIGESTETLVPKGQIYTEMSELLGRVAEETNYSFGDKATVLSGLPGLGVKGCGILALPMRKENAAEIEKQGKVVREKVWMVTGDQVEVKNPEWVEGLEKLGKMSAEKLGFKNVALRPVLDKLLLYEEGGQFEKQKDGVYEEETQKQARYKFGKDDGAAQFDPYFVVYTAGAHRVVEKVTSGCCLMLLYSLCLPRDDVEVKSESGTPNCVDNANTLNTSAIFAFMLSRSCQKNLIEAKGIEALSGVDFNRCQLLEEANALVHPKHQLKLYIARLHFNHNGRWGASQAQESASLYSLSGQSLGEVRLELILALTDALGDDPDARTALTKIAMEKVHCLLIINSDAFISPSSLTLLWKHAVARENKNIFIDARDVFMKKDGKFLGSVVKALSAFVHAESQPVHQFALISLASRRRSWLLAEIKNISKPFTYEIPPSDIPGAAELVSFFCGTDSSYIIRGFTSITQARSRVGLLSRRLKTSGLVMTAEGRGRNSFVRMIKRGTMFDPRKQKILEYKAEVAHLDQLILLSRSNISGHKHPRDDASTVVTIE